MAISIPPPARIALALVPREPRFAVRLPLRMSREGTNSLQVALPEAFHNRLKVEVMGSLNHAFIALVRQALAWLDTANQTLVIDLSRDPLNPEVMRHPRSSSDPDLDRRIDWAYPHKMFAEVARQGTVVANLKNRPSRANVVHVQIGVPPDLQTRLREEGVGAVSQLLVYLARYAFMRLEAEGLSLHVSPSQSDIQSANPTTLVGAIHCTSVGELMTQLGRYTSDTRVTTRSGTVAAITDGLTVCEQRDRTGALISLVIGADA